MSSYTDQSKAPYFAVDVQKIFHLPCGGAQWKGIQRMFSTEAEAAAHAQEQTEETGRDWEVYRADDLFTASGGCMGMVFCPENHPDVIALEKKAQAIKDWARGYFTEDEERSIAQLWAAYHARIAQLSTCP